jgi:hypothetical protein
VVALQLPELTDRRSRPWSARLFYAYADALLDAGREDEARSWFARSAAADPDGETDAAERFDELDDVVIDDLAGDGDGPAEEAEGDISLDRTLPGPGMDAECFVTDSGESAGASGRSSQR